MNVHFPDAGTIRTVLALTSRAPSVHNTQPWRWLVGGQSLHLYSDADRQLPNIDPDGRDLILSCGAALHHCVVGFAAVGWRAKVNRFPNPADPSHLAAIELSRSTADPVDIALGGRGDPAAPDRPASLQYLAATRGRYWCDGRASCSERCNAVPSRRHR